MHSSSLAPRVVFANPPANFRSRKSYSSFYTLTDYSQFIVFTHSPAISLTSVRMHVPIPMSCRKTRMCDALARKHELGRQGSRAVQGCQRRRTVRTAEHEGRTHRRPATSGAVPVELKVAEITAVHSAVALVGLALLLQYHTPPFCSRVLEPDLRTRRAEGFSRYVRQLELSLKFTYELAKFNYKREKTRLI